MRIHHLSAATLCPRIPGRWLNELGHVVCHCLLIETDDGLVLVDSGLGLDDVARPRRRLGFWFVDLLGPRLDPAETVARQVEALGFRREDVRHVIPTHLDLDHAGGLPDFPGAKVHVLAAEHAAAMRPRGIVETHRYRPAHWAHGPDWAIHAPGGDRWMGFESVRPIPGLDVDIAIIPLYGHTRGHAGVAVRDEGGWWLHCGDAYFHHDEVEGQLSDVPPLLAGFERFVQMDRDARIANRDRLRALHRERGDEVRLFSAHDPTEYHRCG